MDSHCDLKTFNPPIITETYKLGSKKITVIRDDKLLGGTKQRAIGQFLDNHQEMEEFVYAGPATGFAQVALTVACLKMNKIATLFIQNSSKFDNTRLTDWCRKAGAQVFLSKHKLETIQNKAKEYIINKPTAFLIPFGFDSEEFSDILYQQLKDVLVDIQPPKRLWLVVGSGTLLRVLGKIWKNTQFYCVQVGKTMWEDQYSPELWERMGGQERIDMLKAPQKFFEDTDILPPYPSVASYDAKVWQMVKNYAKTGDYVWNVASDTETLACDPEALVLKISSPKPSPKPSPKSSPTKSPSRVELLKTGTVYKGTLMDFLGMRDLLEEYAEKWNNKKVHRAAMDYENASEEEVEVTIAYKNEKYHITTEGIKIALKDKKKSKHLVEGVFQLLDDITLSHPPSATKASPKPSPIKNLTIKDVQIVYRHNKKEKVIYITDVPRLWVKYPSLLLILEPERLLTSEKNPSTDAITVDNFEKSHRYKRELEKYTSYMNELLTTAMNAQGYTLDTLVNLDFFPTPVSVLTQQTENKEKIENNEEIENKEEFISPGIDLVFDTEVPLRKVVKFESKKRKVNIEKKIEELDEDQILNVSKITDTGAGTKVLKLNTKKKIFQTKHGEMESDNLSAFMTAISLIPNAEKDYAKDIKKAKEYFK